MDTCGDLLLTTGTNSAIIWSAMQTTEPRVTFNTQLIAEDMALKGWSKLDLANEAGIADMTVIRFLRGEVQTAPTAKKIAKALGRSVARYIVPATAVSGNHDSGAYAR